MGADEAGTLARLKALRRELVDPKITEYRGRIVKTTGDGLLLEFKSVTDAVLCAVDVQREMRERNVEESADRRIEFRIGINVGEIIIDGRDIHGDGVNIAARLENLAEPGGICVSARVHEDIAGKLDLNLVDMGDQTLKNIARQIHVYSVAAAQASPTTPTAAAKAARAGVDRPSIAVLPFDNLSGDPEQEFLADGITEDITTQLARLPNFFVVARNSAFTYKGRAVDVRNVAKELDVRYVVEGSLQKAGGRVRVTGQLVEAASGRHLWADRYDRDLQDIFAIQDDITQAIFAALQPHLFQAEAELAQRKPAENLDAWGLTVRARVKWYDIKRDSLDEVVRLCRQAIAVDPTYAMAHAILGAALGFGAYTLISEDFVKMGREAMAESNRAIELDGDDPEVLLGAGLCFYFLGQFHKANGLLERAVELNPNLAMGCAAYGLTLGIVGRPDDGIASIERAIKLSPRDPQMYLFHNWLAFCHFVAGRYDEAIQFAERSVRPKPRYFEGWVYMAAALAERGRGEDAARAIKKALELVPPLTLAVYRRPRTSGTLWQKLVDGLEKAGLPA